VIIHTQFDEVYFSAKNGLATQLIKKIIGRPGSTLYAIESA